MVYQAEIVKLINSYYGEALSPNKELTIGLHLRRLAHLMYQGIQGGNLYLLTEVNNYHPNYLGQSTEDILQTGFPQHVCLETILHEHGFSDIQILDEIDYVQYNLPFEQAVE